MAHTLMILPTYPFGAGSEPSDVEYEATPVDGSMESVVAPLGESARLETDPPYRIRYRFLWDGRPGPWSDEGVTWQKPS